jgi:TRAP-type C4-dicarboxylate transport system substrate-binding protein
MQAERLATHIAEESKDGMKLDLFIAAQLGNEQDTIQQVQRGRIDMGGFSTVAATTLVPEFGLFNLPFYFASVKEQDCALDALTGDITALLDSKGIRFAGWADVGTSDIIGKKPFLSPSEVKGIKAAANPHRISAVMWQTLGANPNPLGITEIIPAFQSGMVEVQTQVVTFYVPSGLSKFAPVLTRMNLSNTPGMVLINKGIYDKLSADHRAAFDRAMARTPAAQMRQEIRGFEQVLRDKHVKDGGQVVQANDAQREEWRKALQPAWPEMIKSINGGEAFFAKLEAARGKCKG